MSTPLYKFFCAPYCKPIFLFRLTFCVCFDNLLIILLTKTEVIFIMFYIPNPDKDPMLSRQEAINLLNIPDGEIDSLIQYAGFFRKKYKGNHVSIHLLTNVRSGNCSQDCSYCAQSCQSHADIEKYRWVDDKKLYEDHAFVHDHSLSIHCIGLSGIRFTDEDIEKLAEKIRKMKSDGTHICCSIGFLTESIMSRQTHGSKIRYSLCSRSGSLF